MTWQTTIWMISALAWTLVAVYVGFLLATRLLRGLWMAMDRDLNVQAEVAELTEQVQKQTSQMNQLEETIRVAIKGRSLGSPLATQVGEKPMDPIQAGWVDQPIPPGASVKQRPPGKSSALGQPS